MLNKFINSFGLLLNIAGVILLFFYGPPQPNFEEGVGLGLEDGNKLQTGQTVAEHNKEIRKKKRKHEILSRIALILIFLGFIFQLIAALLA